MLGILIRVIDVNRQRHVTSRGGKERLNGPLQEACHFRALTFRTLQR